jgi:purine-binding chemotaxis protein CheW
MKSEIQIHVIRAHQGGTFERSEQDMGFVTFSTHDVVKPSLSEDKLRPYVVFRINQQHYALPLDDVIRVVRMVAVTPIPDAPQSILGLISMAGQMIPVIDLKGLFGKTGNQPEIQDVLLIDQIHDQTIAVIADEVLNIMEFSPKQIQSPPAAVSQSRFLSSAIQQGDNLILVLDAPHLLPNDNGKLIDGAT